MLEMEKRGEQHQGNPNSVGKAYKDDNGEFRGQLILDEWSYYCGSKEIGNDTGGERDANIT